MDSSRFFRPRNDDDKVAPLALRPRDAAAALGISPSTLERLTRAGEIPHVRINRLVLYRVDSLRKWLQEREEKSRKPQPESN